MLYNYLVLKHQRHQRSNLKNLTPVAEPSKTGYNRAPAQIIEYNVKRNQRCLSRVSKFGLRESKISYNLFNGVNLSLHFRMLLSFINSGDKRQIILLELNAYCIYL